MNRVLVIGATSQVGIFSLPLLASQGWEMLALSRRGAPQWFPRLPGLEWVTPSAGRWDPHGVTHLLSAGPMDLALEWANRLPALQGMAVTSSSSVLSKAESPDAREARQMMGLRQLEHALTALGQRRELSFLLLQPTLIYGCGLDRNISRLAAFIDRYGFIPVAWNAEGLRQPIHAADVAEALVKGLGLAPNALLSGPLCGGETLKYSQMVQRLFNALDRPVRLLRTPTWMLAWLTSMAKGGRAQMVYRQGQNLTFDDNPVRSALNLSPRDFRPNRDDFHTPSTSRLERLARGH